MGLLDIALGGVLGGARGGLGRSRRGSPIVNAVLMALAAKALQSYLAQRRQAQAPGGQIPGGQAAQPHGGGLGDILGNVLGGGPPGGHPGGVLGDLGGGLGGILGSLGGAGGLGGLLEQLNRRGLAGQTQSWIGTGGNQPIQPQQLADALDDDDIDDLAQSTGLPRDQVLHEVAQALPDAIDQLTPDGRIPNEAELAALAARYEAQARAAG